AADPTSALSTSNRVIVVSLRGCAPVAQGGSDARDVASVAEDGRASLVTPPPRPAAVRQSARAAASAGRAGVAPPRGRAGSPRGEPRAARGGRWAGRGRGPVGSCPPPARLRWAVCRQTVAPAWWAVCRQTLAPAWRAVCRRTVAP